MKRYLLPLLLLLPTLALAQNPFSCADVEILEPGWVCHEHFGWNFGDNLGIVGFLPRVSVDAKGSVYRPWREDIPDGELCGANARRQTILRRYDAGWGTPGGENARVDVFRMRDRCVSGTIGDWNTMIAVQPLPGGSILAVDAINGGPGGYWVIRLDREPVMVAPPPSEDAPGSPGLARRPADGEGASSAGAIVGADVHQHRIGAGEGRNAQ